MRILVVEDDADLRAHIVRHLRQGLPDATIEDAPDLDHARRMLERTRYTHVLSDNHLPDGEGLDLLARLSREHPETARILMTGFADLEVATRAINQGHVHALLEKPVHDQVLVGAILNATKGAQPTTHETSPHGDVLLVDDDPEIRRVVVSYFRLALPDVHLDVAKDAREGLALVAAHPPDVILADLHLPDMSGADFLARAREGAPRARTAMITGDPDPGLAHNEARVADRLFIKPMDMRSFARAVQHLLPRS